MFIKAQGQTAESKRCVYMSLESKLLVSLTKLISFSVQTFLNLTA